MNGTFDVLDDVLGSVSDPNDLSCLEVIPSLIDKQGVPNRKFLEFKENVGRAILKQDWKSLWELSDKAQTLSEFCNSIDIMWSSYFQKFNSYKKERKNLAIDINLERFKAKHNQILGSFYVVTYALVESMDTIQDRGLSLTKCCTEVYFTYKNGMFRVVSAFTPFNRIQE